MWTTVTCECYVVAMTKRKLIATALGTLLLTACGSPSAPATARTVPEPVSSAAAENLGMTMLAWELETTPEQKALCARVRSAGVSGTVDAYRARHGGAVADWAASASWLVSTCAKGWNR